MARDLKPACPDCSLPRREFLKSTALGMAAAASIPYLGRRLWADPPAATGETLVQQLFGSLNEEQKKAFTFPFDHPLRSEVDNNWYITEARLNKNLNADQQALVKEIFMKLHSEEYAQRVFEQVEHDNGGAGTFGDCSLALFGEPGTGKFEFVFTGRHVTRRCDGDSVEGAAFGGPIFYGHAYEDFNEAPNHPGNVYWYQALRANELFQALDGKQREQALVTSSRNEEGTSTVQLAKSAGSLAGLAVADMSADQKELVRKVMADVLAPFRAADVAESMKLIEAGGFDNLHVTYAKNQDIGEDGVWDVWQIEGPHMVWYFRGNPHVHTWVNIRDPQA